MTAVTTLPAPRVQPRTPTPQLTHRERLQHRRRRLNLALADLELLDIVGPGWWRIGEEGVELTLTPRQADLLVSALEDIADRLPPRPRPAIHPDQVALAVGPRRRR